MTDWISNARVPTLQRTVDNYRPNEKELRDDEQRTGRFGHSSFYIMALNGSGGVCNAVFSWL
jgi:hypothetical protein